MPRQNRRKIKKLNYCTFVLRYTATTIASCFVILTLACCFIFYRNSGIKIIPYFNTVDRDPPAIPTKGAVWPKPQEQHSSDDFYIVRPQSFQFRIIAESCNLLYNALERYLHIIKNATFPHSRRRNHESVKLKRQLEFLTANKKFAGYLDTLDVLLVNPCKNQEFPTHTMNEKYTLNIGTTGPKNLLSATNIWGVLRGLETFSQLLFPAEQESLQINYTNIYDFPRFSHRGLLLDTSRHFIPIPKIFKTLDAMTYNKLNVFHWHITDDESFSYESRKFPELSKEGAYLESHIYSQLDVKNVITYAGARGIRVIAEFDTPGHTKSWGKAIPELLTPCYKNGSLSRKYGPMDPTKEFLYEFLKDFFEEIVQVFPDQYLHLGGDEVEFDCWQKNSVINNFMKNRNLSTYYQLEGYYTQKLLNIVNGLNATPIVWEEVYLRGAKIPTTTVIQVWQSNWAFTMNLVTKTGFPAILSACWYLDTITGGSDWIRYYSCDPYDSIRTVEQRRLILGGEACMWTEVVNEYNVESTIWPRASAAAEKLWSAENADMVQFARHRLEEHTCRMNKRGIEAQPPNAAGFCEL